MEQQRGKDSAPTAFGCGVECLLRRSVEVSRGQDTQLVGLVAIGKEREHPVIFVAEISQVKKMRWGISQPLNVFLSALVPVWRRPASRNRRLRIRVDVAELSPKANTQAREVVGVLFHAPRTTEHVKRPESSCTTCPGAPMIHISTACDLTSHEVKITGCHKQNDLRYVVGTVPGGTRSRGSPNELDSRSLMLR